MPTAQEEFWRGPFGDAYTLRNRVQWDKRVPFWTDILKRTKARQVLEIGCNLGSNLLALKEAADDGRIMLLGYEPNDLARKMARRNGLPVVNSTADKAGRSGKHDLVFTVGCLIHIPTETLSGDMLAIVNASRRWVLAVEYEADVEELVEYRTKEPGPAKRLWKRPFGRLYEKMGLKMVAQGHVDGADGFDPNGCTWWLLKRPA